MPVRAAGTERFPDSASPLPCWWPLNSGQNLAAEEMERDASQRRAVLVQFSAFTTVKLV